MNTSRLQTIHLDFNVQSGDIIRNRYSKVIQLSEQTFVRFGNNVKNNNVVIKTTYSIHL